MNTATHMQIAETILNQLGGRRFTFMTGSKNFVASKNGLTFKLIRNKLKAKWITITLNSMDLYDIEFKKITRAGDIVIIKRLEGYYGDMLESMFESETGIYTRL